MKLRTVIFFKPTFLVLAALAFWTAWPSTAATTTVTSLADDNSPGTLRSVISAASPGDTVVFQVTGTITLAQGNLEINKNLTINGPGAVSLAISGNNASRVFLIDSGATVIISGVTIQNGKLTNPYELGAGVFNNGGLTLSNVVLTNNSNGYIGGGLFNYGTVTLTNSTVSSNSAWIGGGLANYGTMNVDHSTFVGNTASDNYPGGGGIYNQGNTSPGGVSTPLSISNTTMVGNSAPNGTGGAIFSYNNLTLSFSTLAGNSAAQSNGSAFFNYGSFVMKGTILANNGAGNNCLDYASTATSAGYNLSDDSSCHFFSGAGDRTNTAAGLDPAGLKDNGGPTQTIALIVGSPAIDAIPVNPTNNCTDVRGNPMVNDQRGVGRPQGLNCDIGAFEYGSDNDAGFAQLNSANTFTGNQTVNGTLAATSFTGNGASLTGVNAVSLGGIGAGSYARLDIGNSFSGNQSIAGTLTATALSGSGSGLTNLNPANLAGGTAGINISGTAATASTASNALNLGSIAAANYARLDISNTFAANQTIAGTTTIGTGGTPIVEHLSATVNPSFPALKPAACATTALTLSGAADGDTLALGVSNARMTGASGVILNYSAWVSATDTISIQACNLGTSPQKVAGSGAIRVDLWKH